MLKLRAKAIIAKCLQNRFLKKGEITEEMVNPILREIKTSLLGSDVNLEVVKTFLQEVKDDLLVRKDYSISEEVDVAILSAIRKKLVKVLGERDMDLNYNENRLNKILLVGLNGAGKTTTTAKLAKFAKKSYRSSVKNVSFDSHRPGAFDQLSQLSVPEGIPCFKVDAKKDVKEEIRAQIIQAEEENHKFIFFDSYGLMPENNEFLEQMVKIKEIIKPHEILYVIDAMSGQEILEVVRKFHDALGLTGFIVSKADSHAPMGGVFSVSYMMKLPIKFIGKGETIDDLEKFHPDRIASVILGEGDVLGLAEKMEDRLNEDFTKRMMTRFLNGRFDLDDLVMQIAEIRKLGSGSVGKIMGMLPDSFFPRGSLDIETLENNLRTWEILLSSMTRKERRDPKLFKTQPNRKGFVVGNVVADPQTGVAQNSNNYARLSVACDNRLTRGESPETHFFDLVAWGKNATFIQNFVKKGDKICAEFRIANNSYINKDGAKVKKMDFLIYSVEKLSSGSSSRREGQEPKTEEANNEHRDDVIPNVSLEDLGLS
ncbi:signal recognition particle protein-like [Rattus rattus]|uniref:signal recognition particle protein-like n=1 Tax=Rattus rattus TaxID=10117 RepID=UPI0013F3637F|nr:signal recognition particle protein-like [Rattus rattus]